jgi:membrane-bound metal-dependent hydrolase YbcI (DUF457 family)
MFVGHFGIAMAGRKVDPLPALGTLFLAAQFVDLIWPLFLLTGVETVAIAPGHTAVTPLAFSSYPWSHSLVMSLVWGILFGGLYYLRNRQLKASLLLGGLVVSHWILDFITHVPDLPLAPWNSAKVGLGLWESLPLTLLVEGFIFIAGVWMYVRMTSYNDRIGQIGFWSLIAFLALIHVLNLTGPPPETTTQLGWVGLSQWLLVIWAYWVGAHRRPRIFNN